MNLNDFVVLPNNKARSVKLNARNLQELQMETAILANESREIEEKLQQLKDSMSKEKAERGHSQRFQWASGQFLKSNSLSNGSKKDKESKLQKLSAGKLKIRVLKAEELTAPPQPPPPPPLLTQMARKNRLRGRICGQCEVKTAGIMCAECTENYCVGCFARFHQKGALKFHKMIPTQAELQTHVSARDVVSCFQKQIDPGSCSSTFTTPNPNPNPSTTPSSNHILMCNAITGQGGESPEKGRVAEENPDCSKVLAVSHGEEKKVDITGPPSSLLRGEYSEEESARSFQEALKLWRGKKNDGFWIPVRPVSVSAKATQTALPPDREAEGQRRGGGEERVPVMVEFTENSLTYMDRLLLKKHRRTPFEMYQPSQAFSSDLKSLPATRAEEETASILNEEEEDFRHYCASLFAVPVSRDRPEPQVTTPESCLCIEVLEETGRDMRGVSAEKRADNSIEVPSVQRISKKGRSLVPRTALPSDGSLGVISLSPGATQPFKQFRAPLQPKLAQKLNSSKCQTSQAGSSVKYSGDDDMSSDSLGMASQEEDTSDEDTQMQGPLMRGRSREEQENPAISHLEDSFVRAEAETKKDLQTDKSEQLPELSTVIHNKSSGSGSEQFCDLDGFLPPGLDMIAGQPETPEHAHCDPLHTCQSPLRDSDPTGSEGYRLSSRLGAFKKEHLVSRMMKGNHRQPTGIQIHSSRTREVSANELGTSVDSEFSPAFPPLSQAAKDIMEICNVDQMGCEDPDLEIDTTAHALSSLDQELKLMAKAGTQALVAGTGNGGCQDQCGNPCVIRGGDANEQEEEEVKTDRQSVLLLP
ncbi:uncharacterized protein zbbx isoform X5 [Archocentrus centrarchus]|uniref:uncharacterized protein zbbx isoform X5 n=1 Tax=Archocentrus centrarchus TaxID=63155 RepID=UPI0011EA0B2C|nr:zinc finger B-box domain-containing protein 1 isoform X5 [Archocentrus centrarchus]